MSLLLLLLKTVKHYILQEIIILKEKKVGIRTKQFGLNCIKLQKAGILFGVI